MKSAANHPRRSFLLALAASSLLLLVGSASASAAQAWRVDSLSTSTVAPGDVLDYKVQLTNVGDAAMDGTPVTVTVTLPPGLTVADPGLLSDPSHPHFEPNGLNFRLWQPFSGTPTPCTALDGSPLAGGEQSLKCVSTDPLPPLGVITSPWEMVLFSVDVAPTASGQLLTEVDVSGGGAAPVHTVDPVNVTSAPPDFGIDAFDGQIVDRAGDPYTQAGGHPYANTVSIDFNTTFKPVPLAGMAWPVAPVRDVIVDLPPGLIGNPASAGAKCTLGDLANTVGGFSVLSLCPAESQVGTTTVSLSWAPNHFGPLPVFNLERPPNVPARFGFNLFGSVVVLDGAVRSGGDYGITVRAEGIPEGLAFSGSEVTFWGVPADPSHDRERACPGKVVPSDAGPTCGSGGEPRAFLRNPTSCTEPGVGLKTTARADSWTDPGDFDEASYVTHLPPAYPAPPAQWGDEIGIDGCAKVPFTPSFDGEPGRPEANAPSTFVFDLSIPQGGDPTLISQSDLRKAVVTLPEGVRISPSSAHGLSACSSAQIDLDSGSVPSCPQSSKVGEVRIDTPLLEEPLDGAVYLAKQGDNPFNSLLAIYIVAEGPGVVIKLPGEVEADPVTGQLTTTFDDNPQLPFSNLHLEFKGGPTAALVTPKTCGTYVTRSILTGWSGKEVNLESPFTIDQNCAPERFVPELNAGLANPIAGSRSPFNLQLTRSDADQEFSSIQVKTPEGLAAVLKGVAVCPQSAIDAAKGRGALGGAAAELTAPSCPAASQVGTNVVGAGAGTNPFYVDSGKIYLAGPYKGAPLSFVFVVPAVAGPFDLGSVVVQASVFVDPVTAQVTTKSDPLPSILHGIPLQLRDLRINLDRPDFTTAPTSCQPMSVDASLASTEGAAAQRSERFQVGDCASLGFKPKLSFTFKGKVRRTANPRLIATVKGRPGDANIAKAQVKLPKAALLDNSHIGGVCTRVQFAAGRCPANSIYGKAVATSPILNAPIAGPVYLRSSSHKLPDLVADLRGPETMPIRIELAGKTDSVRGALRNTFEAVPDAPVDTFRLELFGGKRGLVEMGAGFCANRRATIKLDGQNGKVFDTRPKVKASACGGGGKRR